MSHPTEVGLEDLADVHTAGNTQRVEDHVDGGAILEERHVLDRKDRRDDALVAVTAGELVAFLDLASLSDVDAHQLVDASRQVVALFLGEDADADDGAHLAVRNLERRVAHLAGLLTEDGAQQALLGGELGLALGRDLADEDVTGANLGADADDAALVEVGEDLLGGVRDVPRDLLGAELGVASVDLVLLDVNRGKDVVLDEALRQDDRVLEVVTLPAHERDEHVPAKREVTVVGRGAVCQHGADLDAVALVDEHALVVARALVGTLELGDAVGTHRAVVVGDGHQVGTDLVHDSGLGGHDHVTGVDRRAALHAGADERRLGADERNGLALHVGTHEGAVGVVVLEERNQRRSDRHHLARGDVDVVDGVRRHELDLSTLGTHKHALVGEDAVPS